jgi:hypothetical protein
MAFLNTKVKGKRSRSSPEKKWLTTWNLTLIYFQDKTVECLLCNVTGLEEFKGEWKLVN